MRTSRTLIAIAVGAWTLSVPSVVFAAFNGSIDSTSGRPGDKVTVLSADSGPFLVGATGLYLIPAVDPNRPERSISCPDEPGSLFLGSFQQVEFKAQLAFVVPVVPPGAYEIRMDVPNASPSCWRLWPFDVLAAAPATDATATRTTSTSSPIALVALAVLATCGLLVWLRARWSGDIPER